MVTSTIFAPDAPRSAPCCTATESPSGSGAREPGSARSKTTAWCSASKGLDQLWALRSRLEIPLAHVISVEANPAQVGRWWHGLKLWGTDVPGLFAAGTFYYHGELVFWDVRDTARTIIVSLVHERYKKLIVEVADPTETAALLRKAIGAQ